MSKKLSAVSTQHSAKFYIRILRRAVIVVFLAICLGWIPLRTFSIDEDEQGPGSFYYAQYEHQPWSEPQSRRELLIKSGELTLVIVMVAGYLHVRRRAARHR